MESYEELFLECEICDLRFNGIENFQQHLNGRSHRQKSKAQQEKKEQYLDNLDDSDSIYCNTCEKSFSGEIPYYQHMKSSSHKKAERKKKIVEQLKRDMPEVEDVLTPKSDAVSESFFPEPYAKCQTCDKEFSGIESFKQHLNSNVHKKKLKESCIRKKIMQGELFDHSDDGNFESRMLNALEKNRDEDDSEEGIYTCSNCEKSFSGVVPYAQHMTSKSHEKRKKSAKEMENLKLVMEQLENEENSNVSSDEEGDETLTCEICHLAFSGPISMLHHLRSKKHLRVKKIMKFKEKQKLLLKETAKGENLEKEPEKLLFDPLDEASKEIPENLKSSQKYTQIVEARDSLKEIPSSDGAQKMFVESGQERGTQTKPSILGKITGVVKDAVKEIVEE